MGSDLERALDYGKDVLVCKEYPNLEIRDEQVTAAIFNTSKIQAEFSEEQNSMLSSNCLVGVGLS